MRKRANCNIALLFIILSACLCPPVIAIAGEADPGPALKKDGKSDPQKPAASVNGVKILLQDVIKAVEERIPMTGHGSISGKRVGEMRAEALDELIVQEVLFQEAGRKKIKALPEERTAEVTKLKARFPNEEKFQESLKIRGLTMKDIETGIERYLVIKKLADQEVRSKVSVSDEEMRKYYKEHPEQFQLPPQIRLRVLLVAVDPTGLTEDWMNAQKQGKDLADRARKGEDFAGLVKEFSDNRELKDNGGDTGLVHQGRLPYQELEGIVFDQKVGAVGDPVRSLYGYVVYKVEEKKPPVQMKYEDLNKDLFRKEMVESAVEKKLKEWIEGLRAKADIKIY